MSWLTVILRSAGFGSTLDLIEAAEKAPSAASISTAIAAGAAALPTLPDVLINDLGGMASSLVVEGVTKINPAAGAITGALVPGFTQRLEAWLEGELSNLSGGLIQGPTPPATTGS